ncbi:MAG TPA: ribonuclease HI family protein [Firmicutes bacterium]|nr:ribonuclease HI family protein [Bacillota bacterium]
MEELIIHTDGASRSNPGPAGIGVAIFDGDYNLLAEIYEAIGETTNNIAEYTALIRGLEEGLKLSARRVTIYTDSELMARQIRGEYRVKNQGLMPLFEKARILMGRFESCQIHHVPRERNKVADRLANKALEEAVGKC